MAFHFSARRKRLPEQQSNFPDQLTRRRAGPAIRRLADRPPPSAIIRVVN